MTDEELIGKFQTLQSAIENNLSKLNGLATQNELIVNKLQDIDIKLNAINSIVIELKQLTPENFAATFERFEKRLKELGYQLFKMR